MHEKVKAAFEARQAALEDMESAHKALESPEEGADVDALQRSFDEAETAHDAAVKRYDDAKRVSEARANLPVAPLSDPEEKDEPTEERSGSPEAKVTKEPLTYEKKGKHSFFADLYRAKLSSDPDALERLHRHMREVREIEVRTNPSSTAGQGGEFVPPVWLTDEWIAIAKAGRAFADACRSVPLPPNTNSINFPKVSTGATTATQADAGAVSSTDITTTSYSIGVQTVAGQQDISRQLLDRSVPGFDQVVFEELYGRYAINVDTQVLAGGGSGANAQGIDSLSGINTTAYTASTPTVAGLYSVIANAIQKVHTTRFLPPSLIAMHPRRWAWILAASDSNNRPLVTPYAPQNSVANFGRVAPQAFVGSLQGLPVLVDPNIGTLFGAGTNEDRIYVVRTDDLWLMEDSPVRTRVLDEVLSNTLQVRIQLYNYFAFGVRFPKSVSAVTGTGLVTPTF